MILLDEKFDRFWRLVERSAEDQYCKFYMDSGEGREIVTDELDGEDLSGWLIPVQLVAAFRDDWSIGEANREKWSPYYKFARWYKTGEAITIHFE